MVLLMQHYLADNGITHHVQHIIIPSDNRQDTYVYVVMIGKQHVL